MAKKKRAIEPLLRVDLREKYRDTFFASWEGCDLSAQHRFVPGKRGAVVLCFTHESPHARQADTVIESFDDGRTWAAIEPSWYPPCDRGVFSYDGKYMALYRGGMVCWRSLDGQHWYESKVPHAAELLHEGLGIPNCFSAIMITRGLWKGRIVMVSSYFTGQEGPDTELLSSTYSDDWGDSWHCSKLFGPPDPLPGGTEGFGEPAVVQLPSGWLWMVFRSQYGELWQAMSRDGGVTWGPPTPTGFVSPIANCYAVREPSTGATVLCWNATVPGTSAEFISRKSLYRPRTNLVFAVSYDNTRTWTEPVVVDAGQAQYPTIHFANDRMFIMYQSTEGDDPRPWEDMGLTLVAYDTEEILRLPAWTTDTIQPWIERGLVRPWRAAACWSPSGKTIS